MNSKERALLTVLKATPKNYLSIITGYLASIKFNKSISEKIILNFAKMYGIDLSEVEKPISEYRSLNQFFTRKLKPEARKINQENNTIVSPADGMISQFGDIKGDKLLQIKGKLYSIQSLLHSNGGEKYIDGKFMTIYLSPKDYHRVHFPFNGKIKKIDYIKGKLFPVNQFSVKYISDLFTVNERVVVHIEDKKIGNYIVVMVGAINVGSISLSFTNLTTNKFFQKSVERDLNIDIKKGGELGLFNLGSTVIVLFEKDRVKFNKILSNQTIKMGESIGKLV